MTSATVDRPSQPPSLPQRLDSPDVLRVLCAGACRHTEFQLPALYAASSSPSFLQPPPTASGSAPSSQAAQPPRNTLAAASDGRQLLARLTVSGGAVSVKSLSSPVDHARLRCLLDELLCIGEQAVQVS